MYELSVKMLYEIRMTPNIVLTILFATAIFSIDKRLFKTIKVDQRFSSKKCL